MPRRQGRYPTGSRDGDGSFGKYLSLENRDYFFACDKPSRSARRSASPSDVSSAFPASSAIAGISCPWSFGITPPPLPNRLRAFSYPRRGATWRSGYATVCKTGRFGFCLKGHSEKTAKSDPNCTNRLGTVSERRPGKRRSWRILRNILSIVYRPIDKDEF
jgi:hypothetical protein